MGMRRYGWSEVKEGGETQKAYFLNSSGFLYNESITEQMEHTGVCSVSSKSCQKKFRTVLNMCHSTLSARGEKIRKSNSDPKARKPYLVKNQTSNIL